MPQVNGSRWSSRLPMVPGSVSRCRRAMSGTTSCSWISIPGCGRSRRSRPGSAGGDEDDHVRRHAPDFFARRHDGRAVVVDVRPDDRIPERDEQKFAVTAEACEAAGWDYLRSGDLDPGDGRERAVAVALPAPAVPGAGGRRGPAGGFRRVLSVDRGEEPQQAETSKTRALTLTPSTTCSTCLAASLVPADGAVASGG